MMERAEFTPAKVCVGFFGVGAFRVTGQNRSEPTSPTWTYRDLSFSQPATRDRRQSSTDPASHGFRRVGHLKPAPIGSLRVLHEEEFLR